MGLKYTYDAKTGSVEYLWNDNMHLIFTYWGDGQPSKPEEAEGCVELLNNGAWTMSKSCEAKLPFICKMEMIYDPNTDKDLGEAKCDPGWSLISSDKGAEDQKYCYKADERGMEWYNAEAECAEYGSHLMSVHSEYEVKFAQSLSGHENTWIGGALLPPLYGEEGGWAWLDGTPMDWFHWADDEPSGPPDVEQCIEMWTNGLWNDNSCDKLRPFICQKPAAHSFCAVPGPERQQCGPTGVEEAECVYSECCWDGDVNQCFLPDRMGTTIYKCISSWKENLLREKMYPRRPNRRR